MKRKNNLRKATALVLALLLPMACAAVAAEETAAADRTFLFRGGVTWDTTIAQMREIERADDEDTVVYQSTNGDFSGFYIEQITLGDVPAELAYYFYLDQLLFTGYYFPDAEEGTFDAVYAMTAAEYGEATALDKAPLCDLMNAVAPDSVTEEDISAVAGWVFGDETRLYLLRMNGDCYLLYFNEARTLALNELAAAPEPTLAPAAPEPAETPIEEPAPTLAPEPTAMPDAAAFAFRGGITWDSTVEQVKAAEGIAADSDAELMEEGDYKALFLPDAAYAGETAELVYYYYRDRLIFMGYYISGGDEDTFDALYAAAAADYGEATEFDKALLSDLMNAIGSGDIAEEDIDAIAGWALGDGTRAYVFLTFGDAYLMYFNEERALAISASPAVPEPTLAPVAPEPAATPAEEPAPTLAPEPTSAPSADVFTFRNGITWDTPVEQMLLAEGAQDGTDYETIAYGPNENYMFTTTDDAGNELQVAYAFHDGLPVFMAEYFVSDTEAGFVARRENYAAKYGEPTETDADAMFALFDIVSMGTVEHDSVQDFAGWLLRDGTHAYLLLADGEVYIFFMNEARILAVYGGEAAEPFEFRGGITWATTVEEMLAIEGTDYGPEKDELPGTDYAVYVFSGAPLDGETVDFAYYYIGDQLVVAAYHYPNDDPEDFAARRDRVSARYGEPAETDVAEVAELFGLVSGGADITEHIDAFASWSLADGTQIILSDMRGDITMFCFNGPAMPDEQN